MVEQNHSQYWMGEYQGVFNNLPFLREVIDELDSATKKYKDFNSAHEGYAVILEELDELWDEIKKRKPSRDRISKEAVQVAAMAFRFLRDCC